MINLGIKNKCENCIYGCVVKENRKIKRIFCGKFQSYISLLKYNKMRVCMFFREEDV